jgi:hypothetical protein
MKVLSPKTQYNLANARTYFEEHLGSGDYYSEGQKVRGEWTGAGAQRLCLNGEVSKEEFHALCENRHPHSRARLTQQSPRTPALKPGTRQRHAPKRRIFYDFTISPPKSVSIACLAGNNPEIAVAHGQAIKEAVSEMEQFAATRVRRAGAPDIVSLIDICLSCLLMVQPSVMAEVLTSKEARERGLITRILPVRLDVPPTLDDGVILQLKEGVEERWHGLGIGILRLRFSKEPPAGSLVLKKPENC